MRSNWDPALIRRVAEVQGEDAFFDGTMSIAFVQGLQGTDPKYWKTASLQKHFLANSNETTSGGSSSDFYPRLFREYYSLPFRMAFEQGGARSFMASYNAWNHVPMTVSPVLSSIAAKQWGRMGLSLPTRRTESDLDAAPRGKLRTVIRFGLPDPSARVPYSQIGLAGEPEP